MCNAYNHPPGCTCGWGGDGHAGTSYGWQRLTPTIANGGIRVWPETNYTRPTHCPECGEDVYFIRHNGGSVWVDPPLGWPWPKHACFDKPNEPTHAFSTWSAKSSGLTNPKLGMIVRISNESETSEPRIEIRLPDASRVTVVLRWTPADSDMLGALVIFSKEDSLLLHQTHAEIPFHSFSEKPKMAFGWYQCPRCKATVKEHTGHEEYCRKHYDPTKIKITISHKLNRPKWAKSTPKQTDGLPQLVASSAAKEERILKAVERIAREAWEIPMLGALPEICLKLAKQEALGLINMLSPAIRREVKHRFTSQKWEPLISRKPK